MQLNNMFGVLVFKYGILFNIKITFLCIQKNIYSRDLDACIPQIIFAV